MAKKVIKNMFLGLFLILCYKISNTYFKVDTSCEAVYLKDKSLTFYGEVSHKYVPNKWNKVTMLDITISDGSNKNLTTTGIAGLETYVAVGDSIFKGRGNAYYTIKRGDVTKRFYIEYGIGCTQ